MGKTTITSAKICKKAELQKRVNGIQNRLEILKGDDYCKEPCLSFYLECKNNIAILIYRYYYGSIKDDEYVLKRCSMELLNTSMRYLYELIEGIMDECLFDENWEDGTESFYADLYYDEK